MSDYRTSRAPFSRLPEDDLPEIDWGGASFTQGGGDMPEPEPMPDPSEEERAMARLRARIAERDAPLMDPWAQEQAVPLPGPHPSPSSLASGPLAPLRAPRMGRSDIGFPAVGMPEMMPPAAPPAPPMNPQQAAQAAFRQPALDAVRAGVGAVTPPPDPLPGSPAPLRAPRGGRSDAMGIGPELGAIEMGPAVMPPPMTPQQSAQAAFRQPALDAVRAGVGAVTPPVDPMAPPSSPTAPDAVPQATTDPNAPTVTAGSQAAGLAQRPAAPQSPTMAPTGAPQFAMGATGLGGVQSGMSDRVAAGAPDGNVFGRQLDAARNEDVRRERIRKIILGIGAMLGAGTGNMGLMLPAAIGAGLVRDPDEEATLRANDERAQAVGGAQAEQRALLEQLAMRREAQQAQERQGQQTLALRAAELQGTQEDRRTRTGLEVARTDPSSGRSGQMREALVRFARTLPPEVQQSVLSGDLSGLSAEESERLILSLSNIEGERQRGGGAGAGGQLGAGGGRIGGLNSAPDSFVMNVRMGSPGLTLEQAQARADADWATMPARQRATWQSTEQGVSSARALAQNLPGYEQTNPGAVSPAQFAEAQDIVAGEEAFGVAMDRAVNAAQRVEALPVAEQAAVRAAGVVGVDANEDMAEFNDARGAIISALNRMAGGGTMDASEYARWDAMLPTLASVRGLAPGAATRRLQAAAERARETAAAEMRARGYRRVAPSGQPTTTADAPPAPEREHPIVFRVRLPDGRVQQIRTTPSRAEADQARARERGWTVVQ